MSKCLNKSLCKCNKLTWEISKSHKYLCSANSLLKHLMLHLNLLSNKHKNCILNKKNKRWFLWKEWWQKLIREEGHRDQIQWNKWLNLWLKLLLYLIRLMRALVLKRMNLHKLFYIIKLWKILLLCKYKCKIWKS